MEWQLPNFVSVTLTLLMKYFSYITYYLGRTDTLITLPPVFDDVPELDQSEAEYPSSFGTQFSILLARKMKQFCRNTVS